MWHFRQIVVTSSSDMIVYITANAFMKSLSKTWAYRIVPVRNIFVAFILWNLIDAVFLGIGKLTLSSYAMWSMLEMYAGICTQWKTHWLKLMPSGAALHCAEQHHLTSHSWEQHTECRMLTCQLVLSLVPFSVINNDTAIFSFNGASSMRYTLSWSCFNWINMHCCSGTLASSKQNVLCRFH